MRFHPIRLVSSQPKKPQGPVTLLKSTHLVLRIRSADCRWAFAGRGPWAMFLENGFRSRDLNMGIGIYVFASTVRDSSKRNIRCIRLSHRFDYLKIVAFAERFASAYFQKPLIVKITAFSLKSDHSLNNELGLNYGTSCHE